MAQHLQSAEEKIIEDVSTGLQPVLQYFVDIYQTMALQFGSWSALIQLGIIAVAGLLAVLLARPLRGLVTRVWPESTRSVSVRLREMVDKLIFPALWVLFLWISTAALRGMGEGNDVVRIAASLLNAWILIRLFTTVVADPFWSRVFATAAWFVAALSVLRLLNPTITLLDSVALTIGDTRVSIYLLLKGGVIAAILLWIAAGASNVLQTRLRSTRRLTPSVQVLIGQLAKFTFLFVAIVIALNTVGIDLTALAIFSGAVGVGIGFGLQKIVSNLISGIILLMDRSIKPGDVIEVGGTYGRVTSLGARYASVLTRDGTEHLIPNEELIIGRVVNWSHSNPNVRQKVPVGISYKSDIELAKRLVIEACAETDRILKYPEPNCLLRGFGDSSVDFEARYWINDPSEGIANVASEMLFRVWHKFAEHGIEIPYPQRDLHVRSGLHPAEKDDAKTEKAELAA